MVEWVKKKKRSSLDKIEHRLLPVTDQKLDLEIKTTHLGLEKMVFGYNYYVVMVTIVVETTMENSGTFQPGISPQKKGGHCDSMGHTNFALATFIIEILGK